MDTHIFLQNDALSAYSEGAVAQLRLFFWTVTILYEYFHGTLQNRNGKKLCTRYALGRKGSCGLHKMVLASSPR